MGPEVLSVHVWAARFSSCGDRQAADIDSWGNLPEGMGAGCDSEADPRAIRPGEAAGAGFDREQHREQRYWERSIIVYYLSISLVHKE